MGGRYAVPLVNVGGFLPPFPDKAAAEIANRWPDLPIDAIGRAFGWYILQRAAEADAPSAAEIKRRAVRWQKAAAEMAAATEQVRQTVVWSFVREKAVLADCPDALSDIQTALTFLDLALPRVVESLPSGHAISARHHLVAEIGGILHAAGFTVDRRPTGALCLIVGILLEAAGEVPPSIVEIVKPVVRGLKK